MLTIFIKWEILNSVSEDEIVPAITEEENVKDFMEKATQTVLTVSKTSHSGIQTNLKHCVGERPGTRPRKKFYLMLDNYPLKAFWQVIWLLS